MPHMRSGGSGEIEERRIRKPAKIWARGEVTRDVRHGYIWYPKTKSSESEFEVHASPWPGYSVHQTFKCLCVPREARFGFPEAGRRFPVLRMRHESPRMWDSRVLAKRNAG